MTKLQERIDELSKEDINLLSNDFINELTQIDSLRQHNTAHTVKTTNEWRYDIESMEKVLISLASSLKGTSISFKQVDTACQKHMPYLEQISKTKIKYNL